MVMVVVVVVVVVVMVMVIMMVMVMVVVVGLFSGNVHLKLQNTKNTNCIRYITHKYKRYQ